MYIMPCVFQKFVCTIVNFYFQFPEKNIFIVGYYFCRLETFLHDKKRKITNKHLE